MPSYSYTLCFLKINIFSNNLSNSIRVKYIRTLLYTRNSHSYKAKQLGFPCTVQ